VAGFANLRAFAAAQEESGNSRLYTWRKSPSQVTVSGVWFDLSMMPGNPLPNYYASTPLVAATLNGADGLFHGGDVSPSTKRLKSLLAMTTTATALPLELILLDYLLYYPFLDMGSNDEQTLTNGVTLPRYVTGDNVQVMAVMTNPQSGNAATFSFDYTNQDGTAGRTSQVVTCGPATVFGSLINTAPATAGASQFFIGLQGTDTGVRSIQTFRMVAGVDVGLICLVLVRPIASLRIRGIDAPVEIEYLRDAAQLPAIEDGAYLNFICHPVGSLAATAIHGTATFVWN